MRRILAAVVMLAGSAPVAVAHADAGAAAAAEPRRVVAPMQSAGDSVCNVLRADRHDVCKRIASADHAQVFQSGSKRGIRRVVLAVDRGGEQLISEGSDFLGEDCAGGSCIALTSLTPTVRDIAIDGRAGVMLDLVAKFRDNGAGTHWQTESLVGCAPSATGAWKCETLDLDRCTASVGDDGTLTTSCSAPAKLTLGS